MLQIMQIFICFQTFKYKFKITKKLIKIQILKFKTFLFKIKIRNNLKFFLYFIYSNKQLLRTINPKKI